MKQKLEEIRAAAHEALAGDLNLAARTHSSIIRALSAAEYVLLCSIIAFHIQFGGIVTYIQKKCKCFFGK